MKDYKYMADKMDREITFFNILSIVVFVSGVALLIAFVINFLFQ